MSSNACIFLNKNSHNIKFFLPSKCPSDKALVCSNSPIILVQENGSSSKQAFQGEQVAQGEDVPLNLTPPWKRSSRKETPMVDSALRRSSRLREVSRGFKANSCSSKKCLACCPDPPTISIKTLQFLGSEFCKLNLEDVIEEALLKKRRHTSHIAAKKCKKAPNKEQTLETKEGGPQDQRQDQMKE